MSTGAHVRGCGPDETTCEMLCKHPTNTPVPRLSHRQAPRNTHTWEASGISEAGKHTPCRHLAGGSFPMSPSASKRTRAALSEESMGQDQGSTDSSVRREESEGHGSPGPVSAAEGRVEARHRPPSAGSVTVAVCLPCYVHASGSPVTSCEESQFHRLQIQGPGRGHRVPMSPDAKTSSPSGQQAHGGPTGRRRIDRLRLSLSYKLQSGNNWSPFKEGTTQRWGVGNDDPPREEVDTDSDPGGIWGWASSS